jgi:PAS domain S-box-containing protein
MPAGPHPAPSGASALHWSEERFRLLVDSVKDYAIFMLDPEGRITSWNAGAERIKGYLPHEIIGQHFSRFYTERDVRSGKPARELVVAAEQGRLEDEGLRVRKDGSQFWASVVITPLYDQGELVGYAKVTRDLTERRQAEEERLRLAQVEQAVRTKDQFLEREQAARRAAEEARSSLETTLRSIGDAVMSTDGQGKITMMNPVAEQLTGWKASDALGQPLHTVFHIINEGTRHTVESPVDRVLREGVVVGLANHTVLVARNGTETPIADSGAPIRGDSGEIRGVVLVFRDASPEVRAASRRAFLAEATAVLVSSLDYRETLARLANVVVPRLADWCSVEVLDPPDHSVLSQVAVAHLDPAKVELARQLRVRYPSDADSPRGAAHVVQTGWPEYYLEITDSMLVQGAVDAGHLRILRELGLQSAVVVPMMSAKRALGALTLVYAESGRRYTEDDMALAEDLARRAAMTIENSRLYEAEQHARDLADAASRAKDEFLAAVSHELRTPLSAILGWTKMLAGLGMDERKRAHGLATIERNALAMTRLIEDLLDVSRIVSGKLRLDMGTVLLPRVIEAAVESARPAAEAKSLHIELALDRDVEPVRGDPARLQQVIWNLIHNAVKFTPPAGRVDISLRQRESDVEIAVKDTGKGIEPRFLAHVFDAFRQADGTMARSSGGLGLGLAIVKHLVELHGGQVEAQSEGVGRGATFIVSLPLAAMRSARRPAEHASEAPPFAPPPQLKGLRVLIVEDDDDTRELLEEVLAQCGAHVRTVSNVADGLSAFDQEVPDVLVADIGMPGETGYDLIRLIRARPPSMGGNVPAAALTAYTRPEDRRQALNAGYQIHVPKPVEPAELATIVASLARFEAR